MRYNIVCLLLALSSSSPFPCFLISLVLSSHDLCLLPFLFPLFVGVQILVVPALVCVDSFVECFHPPFFVHCMGMTSVGRHPIQLSHLC